MQQFLLSIIFVTILSLSKQSDVALPSTIIPMVYNLVLRLSGNLSSRSYTGENLFRFHVLEDINEIWLNSRQHQVSEALMFYENDTFIANTTITRESEEIVRFLLPSNLAANRTYQMLITFSGNLMITSDGFFRSAYSVFDESGTERFV